MCLTNTALAAAFVYGVVRQETVLLGCWQKGAKSKELHFGFARCDPLKFPQRAGFSMTATVMPIWNALSPSLPVLSLFTLSDGKRRDGFARLIENAISCARRSARPE